MKTHLILLALLATLPLVSFGADFTDNGDGTVTDRDTDLTWQQQINHETMDWESALAHCEGLTHAGVSDWRLPNRSELLSIVNFDRFNPAIDTVFFPNTWRASHWSSTALADHSGFAWHVSFNYGYARHGRRSYEAHVRCVR